MTATARAILTDTTLCIGCDECVKACKSEFKLPPDRLWPWQKDIEDLSAARYTTLIRRPGNRHVRRQCRHCLKPACAAACPVGALRKQPDGPVTYDRTRCIGCRYCMLACPYGIPRYDWESRAPLIHKCQFCPDRLALGEQPACTAACPEKATIFGTRAELVALARERIRRRPHLYRNKVYGLTEVGGTSVLYISDIDLGFLGVRKGLAEEDLPGLTLGALGRIPAALIGGGCLLFGTWWLLGRRMRLAAERAERSDRQEEGR